MSESRVVALCFSGRFCGGAERMMISLQQLLQERGYQTPLILNGSGDVQARFSNSGLPVQHLEARTFASKWFPLPYLWNVLRLSTLLRKVRPQVAIVEGKILTQIAAVAGRLAKVPIISYVHYPPSPYEVRRMLYQDVDQLVLCCAGLKKYFQNIEVPCEVLRNYIDHNSFSPADNNTRVELKQKILDVSPETPTISLVGHLSQIKGQETLISAIAKLQQQEIAVVAAIAGSDNHPEKINEQRIRRQIDQLGLAQQVKLLGKVEPAADVYRASDIFVLPSHREGLPLVVLEAMSCALPVVATNIDGTPEAVVDGETGFLIEPDDVECLAEKLKLLIEQPELAETLGEAGRSRVEREFAKSQWNDKFLDLIGRYFS